MGTKQTAGQQAIARIKDLIITGVCATLVIKGSLTFGEMLTTGYIAGRLSGPFQNIIAMLAQTQDARISYERLDEIMNDGDAPGANLKFSSAIISFRNVSFRYPGAGNPFVIENLSVYIEPGKTTAIVGESGCGKTTLIKLMMGFYVPQKGDLRLSGTEINDLDCDDWLQHCAAVMQSGFIFSNSIAENVALCGSNIDMKRITRALDIVGLREFVESLPMGYNTRIGATGMELSGGQKQRLLIARAIYKEPEIMFLDEATSSLDATNERIISERIRNIRKGKTLIIAAHRLSTVRHADKILYMERGKIVEQGTHEELIALRGGYYRLVCNQLES